ncbi:MAG: NAD(P)/FAD-dependent oxidoreductase [Campylobacterales bacterium]|nr:NAD(P)/FAD-dependent oxidoreductase [Campylobacterales bacterium]
MKHVIVIGAGYGGLRAVEHLAAQSSLRITLIDKNPYHYLQTEAYGYIAGRFDLHDVAIDLPYWCEGFKQRVVFIRDEVRGIDTAQRRISLGDTELSYDYLILAIGAETNFFSFIPGLREHSFGVKKLQRAFGFRSAFEQLLYEKVESSEGEAVHVAIGGAGLSGVEIAAEMADVIKKHARSIASATAQIKIHLIDASDTILPGMHPYIITQTTRRLHDLGIIIMTGAFIERVEPHRLYFKDGRSLDFRFMIFTGGIKASPIAIEPELPLNRIGQFEVDATLRLEERLFAIGDCAQLRSSDGSLLPPTAQSAERSAEYAADAIIALERGEAPKPFDAAMQGVFVALGGHYAVGELFGRIHVKGTLAYYLKKLITYTYHLGLKLRVNTGFKKRSTYM